MKFGVITFRVLAGLAFALAMTGPSSGEDQARPYDGLKKTVSVDQFQAAESVGGSVTADGLTAMLIDALVKDGRFVVVERPGLASIQSEQMLGAASSTTSETAAKTGQLIGSSAIVKGAVIKYEPAASGASLAVGGLPLGSIFGGQAGVKSQHSVLEISLRVVDTTTGQVMSITTARGSARASSVDAGVVNKYSGTTYGANAFQTTPVGQAAQDAIIKAVDQIAAGMRKVPWSALVVEASDGKIYLNAGANRNVQPGLALTVYRKGKVFTDPSTGEVLEANLDRIGQIRVDTVREKLSTAVVESGETPVRGDLLRLD